MENVNKLTKEEVAEIIQARYNAETRPPRTEEDRKIGAKRWAEIHKRTRERLKKEGYNIN
ncbi:MULTISPECIES: histidine kinase [Aerococcus]|uniref:histidine kinase n=1 Tax=Aerococcus TaxID=1375 RepID=UPI000DCB4F48|nr:MULTISPECIES: histidine kinase [Aerococcus]KAA9298025.1 histidine kinase [Aerococcus tenax]MDK6689641.1 histidine kinase [Aerococcus urinae]MDK8133341.1 histidine kinase [Aerococcus urinae]MDK8484856.1 histidine kinase [Aerococcus urinae]MDL5177711.1 histidine kinase [Aerococcus tenax]